MIWSNSIWLLLFSFCLSGTSSIALDDLLPYGAGNGDLSLPMGSDTSVTVTLPNWFVYYKQRYKTIHISVNGLVSFVSPVYEYDSTLFSQDIPFIAPFLADADTSGTGHVWYNVNNDQHSAPAQYVTEKVALYFEDDSFVPLAVVTVTWDGVGYFPMKTDKVNTFQCILATNGNSSYVLFLYPDNGVTWYQADDRDGLPAQVGFSKGCGDPADIGSGEFLLGSGYGLCGIYKTLDISSTADVVDVDEGSNIEDASPGFYMWMVSSNSIVDGMIVCNNEDLQSITITPTHGHQFGGTPIIISGPCFNIFDDIQCSFGPNVMVNGVVIDDSEALCISPSFKSVTPVNIKLYINSIAIAAATFSIVPYRDGANVMNTNDNLLLRNGSSFTLLWDPSQLLPAAPTNSYLINVALYQLITPMDDSPAYWSNGTTVSSEVFNEGQTTIDILTGPLLPSVDSTSPYEIVLFKLIFVPTISSSNKYITGLSSIVNIYDTDESAGLWSHPMVLVVRDDQEYCDHWVNSAMHGAVCDECLPSCPCNVMQAMVPNSGFMLTSSTPGAGILNRFLHPQAKACFTSILSVSSDNNPAQMCCYDDNGDLLVGLPDGGYQSAVSPLSHLSWSLHFLMDISPYMGCCIPSGGLTVDCVAFYNKRPSDNCQGFTPWTPGWFVGDPHLVTLDGLEYTFNGRGEFTLLTTHDDQFTIQGRMVPLPAATETNNGGTVLTSISLSAGYDVIELRADDERILVLINGTRFQLSVGLWHHFVGYTIVYHDSYNMRVLMNDGVTVNLVITQSTEYKYFTGIMLSVGEEFSGEMRGLLGNYNDDPSDDLVPRNSLLSLSPNSTVQEIHESFGMSWIIADTANSLFTYDQSDSFTTYHHPNYVPAFEISFASSTLQSDAVANCLDNSPCLFDVAATGILQVGVATLKEMENINTINESSRPILCDPSCVHGACVDTNRCHCSYGYHGNSCDTPVYKECSNESNPCLNNGQCSLHLFNYVCDCPPNFTGKYCETADCGPLFTDPSSSSLSVSYNSTVQGSVAMYSCITGYNLMGNQYSVCLNNASWSYNNPYCVLVDCGPPSADNSPFLSVSYVSTLYTSVSRYSCDHDQYELRNGEMVRTCTAAGTWSGTQPTCLINCGVPLSLGYGTDVAYNDTVDGSVAVYTCINTEHELHGQDTITCWPNGTWNYSPTGCREVPLNIRLYIIIGSSIAGSVILFTLIVLIVTCSGIVLNKIRTSKKDEYELSEI